MNEIKTCSPQEYIRRLFADTQGGILRMTLDQYDETPYTFSTEMVWTENDVEPIIQRYNELSDALKRIAKVHTELDDESSRVRLLSKEDLEIWNIYVRPYESFDVDETEVWELYERGCDGDWTEEERALWHRYCDWREEQSRKRIPFNRRSSEKMIIRARRYEMLLSLDAPKILVEEEARCLAAEMAIYYGGKEQPVECE